MRRTVHPHVAERIGDTDLERLRPLLHQSVDWAIDAFSDGEGVRRADLAQTLIIEAMARTFLPENVSDEDRMAFVQEIANPALLFVENEAAFAYEDWADSPSEES